MDWNRQLKRARKKKKKTGQLFNGHLASTALGKQELPRTKKLNFKPPDSPKSAPPSLEAGRDEGFNQHVALGSDGIQNATQKKTLR